MAAVDEKVLRKSFLFELLLTGDGSADKFRLMRDIVAVSAEVQICVHSATCPLVVSERFS